MAAPSQSASSSRLHPAFAALLLLFVLAFQGSRSLWEPDEGRYTNVSVEMLRTGDFLIPRLNREHTHFTKPPLTYWAIAASLAAAGRNEWAARLPNALAFFGTILLAGGIARRLAPRRGIAPELIYASMILPYAAANVVTTDTLLTFGETLAMFGFVEWHWGEHAEPRRRFDLLIMWFGFALAFLTKGPPGLLPLLAILAFVGSLQDARSLARLFTIPAMLAFFVVGCGWYLAVVRNNSALLSYFVKDEVAGRVLTSMHHRNGQWYGALVVYIPSLLLGTMPWSLLFFRGPKPRWSSFRNLRDMAFRREHAVPLFLALWVVMPLIVFSIARSRLVFYVLPLMAPLAILCVRRLPEGFALRGQWRILFVAWMTVLVCVKFAGAHYTGAKSEEKADRPFAAAIAKQVPVHPTSIVFVENDAFYGLGLYLDCEIEAAQIGDFDRANPDNEGVEPLEVYLRKTDPARLFAVPSKKEKAFLQSIAQASLAATPSGDYLDWRFFLLSLNDSSKNGH